MTTRNTSARRTRAGSPPPLRVPDFRWLWLGGLVSLTGTQMQFVALPFFVYERTGSTLATAATALVQMLPGVVLGPLAGAVADRVDGRRLLIRANLALACVTLGFWFADVGPWWAALVTVTAQAVLGQLVGPAEHVLLPTLLPPDRLAAGNSLNAANNSLARLLGPAVGGILYTVGGLAVVAGANALSFAVAAVLVGRLSRSTSPAVDPAAATTLETGVASPPSGWRQGWVECRTHPVLRRVLLVVVLTGIGEGCISALLAPYVSEAFGSSTALGLILTCQAAGGLTGALVVSRYLSGGQLPRILGWGLLACGLLLLPLLGYPLFTHALWPALVLVAVAGLPFAVVAAAQTTLLQALPHPSTRGRVFGVAVAAGGAAQLAGIVLSGIAAEYASVYVILADAPCYLVAAVVMLTVPRLGGAPRDRSGPPATRPPGC
jgi:predicted MFS family arabinose efflux permease